MLEHKYEQRNNVVYMNVHKNGKYVGCKNELHNYEQYNYGRYELHIHVIRLNDNYGMYGSLLTTLFM